MFKITLEDENQNKLEFNRLNPAYKITNITGLSPAKATINTNPAAFMDGETFNSSKVGMRTINMAFTIEEPVEANRLAAYRVIRNKKYLKFNYKTSKLDVYAEGHVESFNITHFDKKQVATVTIICNEPYFKRAYETTDGMSNVANMFHFPFWNEVDTNNIVFGRITDTEQTIINNGGIETGLIIELYASDVIKNPKIFDYTTGKFIGVNITMQAGDEIIINTIKGQKSVTLWHNGVKSNIFNNLMKDSTWLQLADNGSVYVFTIEEGLPANLHLQIKHFDLYEGV